MRPTRSSTRPIVPPEREGWPSSPWGRTLSRRRCVSVHARGEGRRNGTQERWRGDAQGLRMRRRSGNVAPRDNHPETMTVDRRVFIGGAAALASAPALGAVSASGETDIAIIGAGAAGIAAARKVAAAGRRFALIEASDHVGGRCVTDTRTFGVPFDRGAHWVHFPDMNPVAR